MRRAFVFFVAFVSLQAAASVSAQPHELIGIRAQGMGGAFVAVADDATATWWNPAGLPNTLFSVVGEVDNGGGRAAAFAIPQFGVSYYRTAISQIQRFDSTARLGPGRQDLGAAGIGLSSSIDQFGVTIGQSIGDHFVVASTLKGMWAQSDSAFDLDVGALARYGALRFGASARNLLEPSFGEQEPDRFRVPRRVRAGVAVSGGGLTLSLDADVSKETQSGQDRRVLTGGGEAWLLGKRLAIRGGVGSELVRSELFVAGGVSVAVHSSVFVDTAMTHNTSSVDVSDRWALGVRVSF